MAHQIPEYLKYISSITINDGGSGYSSNSGSPPTLAITGGGGTGATATLSVFDGVITDVTITNIGSGYTSAPTLTVTDAAGSSGSGADLSAVLGFANVVETEHEETSKLGIKYTVPEFIREDYPKFISFIEKYYEYMDSDGKPNNLLLNKKYNDIDEYTDPELDKRALELAKDFPQILEADRKTLTKNIKDIYESKGSLRSIKAYFKLIYNEEVDVEYPNRSILRASDGVWIQDKTISVTSGYNDFEVLDLIRKTADLVYYETTGSVTRPVRLPIEILTVTKIVPSNPQLYAVKVKFTNGISTLPGPGQGAAATATISGGEVTSISVTNGGSQYIAAPDVSLTSGSGTGFEGRAVVSDGVITSIVINDAGENYTDGSVSIDFDTDPVRTVIIGRGDTLEAENVKAFLSRTVTSVSIGSYSGADAGFSLGEIFVLDETNGDNNNAIVRIDSLDSKNAPDSINIINPGRSFTLAKFNKGIGSITGQSVILTFTTGYLFTENGVFKDDRGKLSNTIRIQDNFRYQSYSYIIKSSIEETTWKKRYKDIMHPAGMQVLGDLVIKNNVGFGDFFAIETEGMRVHQFKLEDVVASDDSLSIAVDYVRDFTETVTITEAHALSVDTSFTDSASISDDYDQDDYAGPDYLPINYVGAGISKYVQRVSNETVVSSDAFVPVVVFTRSFSESPTVSEVPVISFNSPIADSVTTSDLFEFTKGPGFTDTATTSDVMVFNYNNIITDSSTTSENVVINTDKEITDTASASENFAVNYSQPSVTETISATDAGILTIQDYSLTYFSEDYVGESRIL